VSGRVRVTPLGPVERVDPSAVRVPAHEPGRHLWVIMVAYRLSDEEAANASSGEAPGLLDAARVIDAEGPGCLWCVRPWDEAAGRPCEGGPE
jgi:hypothetical protein